MDLCACHWSGHDSQILIEGELASIEVGSLSQGFPDWRRHIAVLIIAEHVSYPWAFISTVENRFLNLDLILFVFHAALRQDWVTIGLVHTPHTIIIFFSSLFFFINDVRELSVRCHWKELACSAQGLSHTTKLSICLNANPTEIVLFQSQDLRLLEELWVNIIVFHLGQEVLGVSSEIWITTRITISDVVNRIQVDWNF